MSQYINIKTKSTYSFYPQNQNPQDIFEISDDLNHIILNYGDCVEILTEGDKVTHVIPLEQDFEEKQKEIEKYENKIKEIEENDRAKIQEEIQPYSILNSTDYKIIKAMEQFLISQPDCSEEILEAHALRQAQRDLINARELEALEQ